MPLATLERITTDPAAGGELAFTADEDMIVHSLHFIFVTDATVANRHPHVVADDGAEIFFRSGQGTAQPASSTWNWCFFNGAEPTVGFGSAFAPLPVGGLMLRKNDRLRTITGNIVAGDNYGAAVLQVERL